MDLREGDRLLCAELDEWLRQHARGSRTPSTTRADRILRSQRLQPRPPWATPQEHGYELAQSRPPRSCGSDRRRVDVAHSLPFVADVSLVFQQRQHSANSRIGGGIRQFRQDLRYARLSEPIQNLHDLALPAAKLSSDIALHPQPLRRCHLTSIGCKGRPSKKMKAPPDSTACFPTYRAATIRMRVFQDHQLPRDFSGEAEEEAGSQPRAAACNTGGSRTQ